MVLEFSWASHEVVVALFVTWLSGLTYVVIKGWKQRAMFYRLRKQGMVCLFLAHVYIRVLMTTQPMPPWNPITGHLLCLAPLVTRFPKDAIQTYLIAELSKDFSETDYLFYLDLWPFAMPMFVITSPDLSIQACQQHDLVKPAVLKPFFNPFAGGDNLFVMNGPEYV
jgi:hypothetical protein